jgi:hypothetical protein
MPPSPVTDADSGFAFVACAVTGPADEPPCHGDTSKVHAARPARSRAAAVKSRRVRRAGVRFAASAHAGPERYAPIR